MAVVIVITNNDTGEALVVTDQRITDAIIDLMGDSLVEDMEASLAATTS